MHTSDEKAAPVWAHALAVGAVWGVVGILSVLLARVTGIEMPGLRFLVPYLTWPLMTPLVALFVQRVPLAGARGLLRHLAFAALLIVPLHGLTFRLVMLVLGRGFPALPYSRAVALYTLAIGLVLYVSTAWPIAAAVAGARAQQAELARARAEAQVAGDELEAVLGQLGPQQLDALLGRARAAVEQLPVDDAADALAAFASDLRAGLEAVERTVWGVGASAQSARARAPQPHHEVERGDPDRRLRLGGWWERRASWTAAAMVLPPMAAIGFPLLYQETSIEGGPWMMTAVVLLRLALLSVSYLLLLEPLRRNALWRASRLRWETGLLLAVISVLIPVLDQLVLQLSGLWRLVPPGRFLMLFARGQVQLYVFMPALLLCGCGLVEFSLTAAAAARRRALRSTQMLARYREARLQLLRAQLHPHFLFNALNSVAALLVRDRDAAVAMMARLQSLYGRSLGSLERPLVSVAEEVDWCREYLEVERQRFSDRLQVSIRVADAAAGASVPPLLLQPLVENAVRHGVARQPGPAFVQITAAMGADGGLELGVANHASGPDAVVDGFGLRHTRRRLAETYGDAARLEVSRRDDVVRAIVRVSSRIASPS